MKRSPIKRKTPLRKMGANKARETAKYWPLRRKFIEEHPMCEFPADGFVDPWTVSCLNGTSSIHHKTNTGK